MEYGSLGRITCDSNGCAFNLQLSDVLSFSPAAATFANELGQVPGIGSTKFAKLSTHISAGAKVSVDLTFTEGYQALFVTDSAAANSALGFAPDAAPDEIIKIDYNLTCLGDCDALSSEITFPLGEYYSANRTTIN